MRKRAGSRGASSIVVALMLIPVCVMVGFVTDLGLYYFTYESARAAAESASIAGVQSALDGIKAGGTYTCGSQGLGCQAATNCASTVPSPTTSNIDNGCAYAISNGFTNGGLGGAQSVTIQANITSPPPTVPGVSVNYWVATRAYQKVPVTFLGVIGATIPTVVVRSTAGVVTTIPPNCVIALDPTATDAVKVGGTASVAVNQCGLAVTSNDQNAALDINGGGTLSAGSVSVVGVTNTHGCSSCLTPSATTVSSVSNPYSELAKPTFSSTCSATNYSFSGSGTTTLSPGTYCGGINVSGGTVIFNPGTYILLGGGFSSSGSSSLSGSGVTFYNTCNPSPCNGTATNFSQLSAAGQSSVTLSAPTSGALAGILFFEDPTVQSGFTDTVVGGSSTCYQGVLYFPKSTLKYAGGTSSCFTSLVADMVSFTGNSNVGLSSAGSAIPSAPVAALIE